MLEDLQENVLTLLEERVAGAIQTIYSLREDKSALEAQTNQLRDELTQRDAKIEELEQRNAELTHFESELKVFQEEREQERLGVDQEKAEVRARLEGLMAMLNSVENEAEKLETEQPSDADDTPETEESA